MCQWCDTFAARAGPIGSYCSGGVRALCVAGYYGAAYNLTTSSCSGQCSAGYYCPVAGMTSPTAYPCGNATVYCLAGSTAPTPVQTGYYSTAFVTNATTATVQVQCAAGSYCSGGVSYPCPGGTFGTTVGATSCGGVCPAGYYCPPGSSSGTANLCGSAAVYWCVGSDVDSGSDVWVSRVGGGGGQRRR